MRGSIRKLSSTQPVGLEDLVEAELGGVALVHGVHQFLDAGERLGAAVVLVDHAGGGLRARHDHVVRLGLADADRLRVMVIEGDRHVRVVRQVRGDVVRAHLDLAVLHVLGVDEQDVVEHAEVLEQRRAHEPVEVRAGDEPVALGGGGSHNWVHPPWHRPVRAESSVSGYQDGHEGERPLQAAVVLGDHRDRPRHRRRASSPRAPAEKTKWLAEAFIQLIKTVTGPVIFVTVVIGIASLGNLARAGGLALRALAYFFSMTVIALALGLIAANVFAPGSRLRRRAERVRARERQGVDRGGRRHRVRARRLHHRRPAADELLCSRSSTTRSCRSWCWRSWSRRRLDARRPLPQADPQHRSRSRPR